jgi:hypothetical protein
MKTRFSKVLLGVFAGVALLAGSAAHASSLTQSQVQSIMSLLQSFNVDQATINNVYASLTGSVVVNPPTPTPTPTPTPGNSCIQLSRSLSFGMSGNDVAQVQAYLGLSRPATSATTHASMLPVSRPLMAFRQRAVLARKRVRSWRSLPAARAQEVARSRYPSSSVRPLP